MVENEIFRNMKKEIIENINNLGNIINDKLNRHIENTNICINNLKDEIKDIKEFIGFNKDNNYHNNSNYIINKTNKHIQKSFSQQNLKVSNAYKLDKKEDHHYKSKNSNKKNKRGKYKKKQINLFWKNLLVIKK